ncbi:MAG: hypothetical protein WB697_05235 [Stellaceae bacterium]
MKFVFGALFLGASMLGSIAAYADADDAKWVAQCVQDNKDEKASIDVITKYCTCMNNKMSSNETQSITQWEKTHVAERQACDKESGWR